MKNKIKYFYLIFGILLIFGLGFLITNKPQKVNCNEPFEVVFIKPSEISESHNLLDYFDIVVIPELNQLNARTEILKCPNFDYSKYINLGA